MEDALPEHLSDDHEEEVLGDLSARDLGEVVDHLGAVGQRGTLNKVHDDDELAGELLIHVRDMDNRIGLRRRTPGLVGEAEGLDVGELAAVVELALQ